MFTIKTVQGDNLLMLCLQLVSAVTKWPEKDGKINYCQIIFELTHS